MAVLTFDDLVTGTMKHGGPFWVTVGGGQGTGSNDYVLNTVILDLSQTGINFRIDAQTPKRLLGLASSFALPSATLISGFAFIFLLFRTPSGDVGRMSLSKARRYAKGRADTVGFADVAGMDEAVEELQELKEVLVSPEKLAELGARPPRGVLMVGPPGCGKTLLARALAGEAGVPFFSLSGSEFTEALVGIGPARVRDLFRQARASAPALIFIDELDAIGKTRMSGDSLN
ncbi:MAG: AAA family ATPase, partial [Thermoplasmata archaeon]